ncbi:MAG: cytochrome P450 [Candidatus Sericytochromatia bacterium]
MREKNNKNNIPQPPLHPILKNLGELDPKAPLQSMFRLSKIYGEIYRLSFPTEDILVIGSQELVNELCDEKRFGKKVHNILQNLRAVAKDGLFTAETTEPNWKKAHKILTPAFNTASIRGMFDKMLDIANQMIIKWEYFSEYTTFDVPDNMTRLTLDTIALCGFNYRFNSFYQNEMHPFIGAMLSGLEEAEARGRRLPLQNKLMIFNQKKFDEDIKFIYKIAGELINNRRKDSNSLEKRDLLGKMLYDKEPSTGEGLSDENIMFQMVTFLVAGHETTSGLLSFALYFMLKNPNILTKAIEEVDRILGKDIPTVEHISKLKYINQILRESLRLWPSAPAFAVTPFEDTIIGGKYSVKAGKTLLIMLPMLHRDTKAWGDDVEIFNPDRFLDENFEKLPPNSWKPFGNGQRACIGRAFAMQEAELVLAMILQNFDIFLADPSYQLKIKETITLKPEGFEIKIRKRGNKVNTLKSQVISNTQKTLKNIEIQKPVLESDLTPLLVLYGSNTGSCEAFAQKIVSESKNNGFLSSIGTMDEYANNLPTEGAVIIVTSSYEGHPPDNAKHFVSWLDSLKSENLKDVKYAVFGCGNKDWSRTYQAIPKKVDEKMSEAGATRIIERGEADARGDFFGDFDNWYKDFWLKLSKSFNKQIKVIKNKSMYEVEILEEKRTNLLRQTELQKGEIVKNVELVNMIDSKARSKRHIEIKLPENMKYKAGDYLSILPLNPIESIERTLNLFNFSHDTHIIINKSEDTISFLPTGYPINIFEILASYVELSQPATRKNLELLLENVEDEKEKDELYNLATDSYLENILQKRISILDLLEKYRSCKISFSLFLELLPPMKTRQYSISSSPLYKEGECSLTVAVVNAPSWCDNGKFKGVASNYLGTSTTGMKVSVAVKPSNVGFHLPSNLEIPIIMIGAGTGLAPFRGFIQERAIQAKNGRKLGKALLFFGCDHPDIDFIYKNELEAWEIDGIVKNKLAFSSITTQNNCKYVQDKLWECRDEVIELLNNNAIIYVCGDGKRMAPAVRETFIKIYQEFKNCSFEEAEKYVLDLERTNSRYVSDVFG